MRQLFPTAGGVDPADAYGRLAALGPSRAGVRVNMIASVDGAASLQGRSSAGRPSRQGLARFFTEAVQRPLVVTVAAAATADRARAAEVADVIIAGDNDVDLARAVSALTKRRHTNVLSEGSPGVAAQLAAAGLLDEVCLVPPSVLELGHVLEADGYLFLRYRRR